MPVTERDQLAAAARDADLRLASQDLDHLLVAWKRYRALVDDLRGRVAPDPMDDDD